MPRCLAPRAPLPGALCPAAWRPYPRCLVQSWVCCLTPPHGTNANHTSLCRALTSGGHRHTDTWGSNAPPKEDATEDTRPQGGGWGWCLVQADPRGRRRDSGRARGWQASPEATPPGKVTPELTLPWKQVSGEWGSSLVHASWMSLNLLNSMCLSKHTGGTGQSPALPSPPGSSDSARQTRSVLEDVLLAPPRSEWARSTQQAWSPWTL